MGLLKIALKSIEIVANDEDDNLALAASWSGKVDLGDLKGKPFMTLTWDQDSVGSQKGAKAMGLSAKMETSTLDLTTSATLTSLQGMRGENVSLLCTPQGTVGVENPIVVVKNFPLLMSGGISLGDSSAIKLHGEKPANDESDIYQLLSAAPA